jgi:outer membrane lipoprotein SlyB
MKKTTLPVILLCALSLSACMSNEPYQTSRPYENAQTQYGAHGTIESIQWMGAQRQSSGAGAVIGGIVGAIVGNQVGGGTGRAVATVAGGIGGAVIGNNLEKNRGDNYYQIRIRMDDGGHHVVHQDDIGNLRNGDRIRIANGRAYLQ